MYILNNLILYFIVMTLICCDIITEAASLHTPSPQKPDLQRINKLINNTRRILSGREVYETRPYMVYLRQALADNGEEPSDPNWLCGGVIIDEQYILTSAACIEDVKQFYVVSGTHKWVPVKNTKNECVNNGAKKAIWKCVPKSYIYDGYEYENIKWMINDIAVVRVDEDFNFNRRVKGCDFIPKKISYNNETADLEKAGTVGSIAGWGSTEGFVDHAINSDALRQPNNSPELLETDVVLLSKKSCKRRWPERYHHIINGNVICGKDSSDRLLTNVCNGNEANCIDLVYKDESDETENIERRVLNPEKLQVHNAMHFLNNRRAKTVSGGFCENDHGGPLVVGQGNSATVIGIMSACLTRDVNNRCYGPFLYTSVYENSMFIGCAIQKQAPETCRRFMMNTPAMETSLKWENKKQSPNESNLRNATATPKKTKIKH